MGIMVQVLSADEWAKVLMKMIVMKIVSKYCRNLQKGVADFTNVLQFFIFKNDRVYQKRNKV